MSLFIKIVEYLAVIFVSEQSFRKIFSQRQNFYFQFLRFQ